MPITEPMEGTQGSPGQNGSNIELNRGTTHLQWRNVGDTSWVDLVAWDDLKGAKGDQGTPGNNGADAKRVVVASGTTNASGDVSFTFSPAFAAAPHVDATITPQTNVNHKCRVTAVSTTGCTVRVESQNQAFLSLLGIDVLSAAVTAVSGATVSITATER